MTAHRWQWREAQEAWVCADCTTTIPRSLVERALTDLEAQGERAVVNLNDLTVDKSTS